MFLWYSLEVRLDILLSSSLFSQRLESLHKLSRSLIFVNNSSFSWKLFSRISFFSSSNMAVFSCISFNSSLSFSSNWFLRFSMLISISLFDVSNAWYIFLRSFDEFSFDCIIVFSSWISCWCFAEFSAMSVSISSIFIWCFAEFSAMSVSISSTFICSFKFSCWYFSASFAFIPWSLFSWINSPISFCISWISLS